MQVIAKRMLKLFWRKHPQAEGPLRSWHATVSKAEWKGPSDAKSAFGPTVDFLRDSRIVFDIGGNKYRIVVHVSYPYKRVPIKFVGTHNEYDRIKAEHVR